MKEPDKKVHTATIRPDPAKKFRVSLNWERDKKDCKNREW